MIKLEYDDVTQYLGTYDNKEIKNVTVKDSYIEITDAASGGLQNHWFYFEDNVEAIGFVESSLGKHVLHAVCNG